MMVYGNKCCAILMLGAAHFSSGDSPCSYMHHDGNFRRYIVSTIKPFARKSGREDVFHNPSW